MEPSKILAYYLMNLPAPTYPLEIDQSLIPRGKRTFEAKCAECHGPDGARINTVIPIDEIRTDDSRLKAVRRSLLWMLNVFDFFQRYPGAHWRKTDGYRAEVLDGIWARAPYLHNGSVPTVYDLLSEVEQRPRVFFRGSNRIDPIKLGFDNGGSSDRGLFRFDVSLLGNANVGHEYGTDLSEEEKNALIEHLKTL